MNFCYNELMTLLFLFVLGAIFGSFIGALTWRWPKEISVLDGRSRCPGCNVKINWYDNIPIFSYLMLHGKCRHCHKKIALRYPLIELSLALLFPLAYLLLPRISKNVGWLLSLGTPAAIFIILVTVTVLVAIFIIDARHQYIPDSLVFAIFLTTLFAFLVTDNARLFHYLAAGAGASVFLLSLNLVTFGKGMGLGDVKLAFALGTILGFPLVLVWVFGAFILGSIVGVAALLAKRAKLKQKIAFGPFLISSFGITLVFGYEILNLLGF